MRSDTLPMEAMERFRSLHLLGNAPPFLEALRRISKVSVCDANVHIQGETGTGKELAARAIHALSPRRKCPFVPVNCGALPDSLVESELFGHARGAFTDAKEAQLGVVGQALGGTLFLDEIDSLSPRSQVVLLRFLQEREYRPVGGRLISDADVRVISASNADLESTVERGGPFRHDLLYRLNVLAVRMPPLRERRPDILPLAHAILERLGRQYRRPGVRLDPESARALDRYAWPGNVRELENVLLREFLLADGPVIRLPALGGARERRPRGSAAITQAAANAETPVATDELFHLARARDRRVRALLPHGPSRPNRRQRQSRGPALWQGAERADQAHQEARAAAGNLRGRLNARPPDPAGGTLPPRRERVENDTAAKAGGTKTRARTRTWTMRAPEGGSPAPRTWIRSTRHLSARWNFIV